MEGYLFTLEEVEEVLPEVAFLMEEALAVQQELREAFSHSIKLAQISTGGEMFAQEDTERNKKQIKVLTEELNDILEEIDDLGVLVRDIDKGIVDFPGSFEGRKIFFCWQLGDKKIRYWHEEDAGSKGRKPIIRLGE